MMSETYSAVRMEGKMLLEVAQKNRPFSGTQVRQRAEALRPSRLLSLSSASREGACRVGGSIFVRITQQTFFPGCLMN